MPVLQGLLILVYLVLEVALVQCPMHDEVLGGVVGQHHDAAAQVGLDGVELEEAQQLVGGREEDHADDGEVVGRVAGYLVSFEGGDALHCQDSAIAHADELVGELVPQHVDAVAQQQYNGEVKCLPAPPQLPLQPPHLGADHEGSNVEEVPHEEHPHPQHEGLDVVEHEEDVADEADPNADLDEAGHQVLPLPVLVVDVGDHQHDGDGLEQLEGVDSQPLPDHLHQHHHKYGEVGEGHVLEPTPPAHPLHQLLAIYHRY